KIDCSAFYCSKPPSLYPLCAHFEKFWLPTDQFYIPLTILFFVEVQLSCNRIAVCHIMCRNMIWCFISSKRNFFILHYFFTIDNNWYPSTSFFLFKTYLQL